MKGPPDDLIDVPVRAQILEIAQAMTAFRTRIAAIAAGLETSEKPPEDAGPTDELSELRADLECALVDSFDPLLRALLAAAGGAQSPAPRCAPPASRHGLDTN